MRLSDIKGTRSIDVVADIIGPVANIAGDKETADFFKRVKVEPDMDARLLAVERTKKYLPPLLKRHKHDICEIMAAIEGTPIKEYEATLTLQKLWRDLVELFSDSAFQMLFFSNAPSGNTQSAGGSETIAEDEV